jgi:DNA-binding IclR family transcriptional regulator
MSKTFVRGLGLLETVGLYGPLTVTELARRTGIDVSIVSRTVSACEPDGWLVRVGGKISVGPRCALLGQVSPTTQMIRIAEPLVHAIAGATGLHVFASALVGRDVMVLASASGLGLQLPDGIGTRVPIHVMASGRAIALQLTPAELDKVVPAEPYPGVESLLGDMADSSAIPSFLAEWQPTAADQPGLARTRTEFVEELKRIRADGFARDNGELHPNIHCIAVPWSASSAPMAIACIGSRDEITSRKTRIEICLRAAAAPGAVVQDVIDAAATVPSTS